MKSFLGLMSVVVVLGIGLGVFVQGVEEKPLVKKGQEQEYRDAVNMLSRMGPTEGEQQPSAEVPETEYDFGLMEPYARSSHTFVVANTGTAPLVLKSGGTSCKCTLSDLSLTELAPGEALPIKLEWKTGEPRKVFRHYAVVNTNDPKKQEIILGIRGEIKSTISAEPSAISFGRLAPETEGTASFLLVSHVWDEFEVERVEAVRDAVQATVEPTDKLPSGATSAAKIRLRTRRGEQIGSFNDVVRVFVRPPADWRAAPDGASAPGSAAGNVAVAPGSRGMLQEDGTVLIEVGVSGKTIRRLSLYSPIIDDVLNYIELGKVKLSQAKGRTWKIIGRIRGDIKPTAVEVQVKGIDGLKVSADEIKYTERSGYSFHITFELSESARPAIHGKFNPGTFILEASGLPGDEGSIEFPVRLDILDDE